MNAFKKALLAVLVCLFITIPVEVDVVHVKMLKVETNTYAGNAADAFVETKEFDFQGI